MNKPNLFFVGHPRSGTGTLDGYLGEHPDIFMAAKELHYFGSDLGFNVPARSQSNYLSYFTNSTGYLCIGESSTWYLCSKTAAQEIKEFSPHAKIIINLRNPVDWLYSLHSHMVYAAYENVPDFETALNLNDTRKKGQNLPSNAFPKMGVIYRELVQYTEQIERYLNAFGKERVLINIFDDLKKDPAAVLDKNLRFLELSTSFARKQEILLGNKKKRNANHHHRSKRLHHWIKSPPRRSILHGVIPAPFIGARTGLRILHKINTKTAERSKLKTELRKKLSQEFLIEIEKLEELLSKDLSAWKN